MTLYSSMLRRKLLHIHHDFFDRFGGDHAVEKNQYKRKFKDHLQKLEHYNR